ncbi:nuclear transport factor 2 family protein [Vibrio variabilis]|uniref:nuclear transport factor 2 family protein n=1 Tax=Vibrio variabilis TaxID=990271 RepID=UPI000DDB73F6|nr:nuclear transport factor 2 family protein [Vibrio variabilis]
MRIRNLFILLIGVVSMNLNAQSQPLSKDEAIIRSNIQSFSAMADQGAFEYLGRLFAPQVTVDYTSLFGGEAAPVNREDLMKQWAAFLPGFDATYHDLRNLKVNVDGDSATAFVDITASHWLGDEGFWAVSGNYEFTLQKSGDNWVIISVTLNSQSESGSRDILGAAPAKAEQNLSKQQAELVKL